LRTRRQRRVAELIHQELSTLLMFKVRDPRVAPVTVTGVDVTPDLKRAHVYYVVLDEAEAEEAQHGLESAAGFLRRALAARVELRYTPEIIFSLDQAEIQGRRIDALLDELDPAEGEGTDG
jgi:ribosome-binding factor A